MPVNKSIAKKKFCFLLTGVLCLFVNMASAQGGNDSVKVIKVKEHKPMSRPAKAMLYSAICPGLGQIYNKRYWKLPIFYAGLGTAIYFYFFNESYFRMYTNQLSSYNPNATYNIYSTSELSDLITYYHNDRDLSIIIAAGVYLIGIVDANVDAQLRGFNVSDDISLRVTPNFVPNPIGGMTFVPGLTLVKRFGK
jgi:hypothetical protein